MFTLQNRNLKSLYNRENFLARSDLLPPDVQHLMPSFTFNAQAEPGDISPQKLGHSEGYPYGSAANSNFVFLAQAGRVLALTGEVK